MLLRAARSNPVLAGPGLAVYQEVVKGNVVVLEQWGPFERNSRFSPCMRRPEAI